MERDRPAIPNAIKREVRQRCGFGCVICGCPLYEYDHMFEWSVFKRHVASEITLLCPFHHSEKTIGQLPSEIVINADKNPFNHKIGITGKHKLFYAGNEAIIKLVSNEFFIKATDETKDFIALVMFDQPILGFSVREGQIFLNILLFDSSNNLVFSVIDNVIEVSINIWDFEYVGTKLTLRSKAYDIFIEIDFLVPNIVHFLRGKIYYNNNRVELGPEFISFKSQILNPSGRMKNCKFHTQIGIAIHNERPTTYGGGMLFVVNKKF